MPRIIGLGHVGIFVKDMAMMADFYSKFIGLTITDRSDDGRLTFLSSRPAEEHHELVLVLSPDKRNVLEHFSFRVATLADLKAYYNEVRAGGYTITRTFNHGNALGCYFLDPEGNQMEVYWATGIDVPQPKVDAMDFGLPEDKIRSLLEQMSKELESKI
ncbi:MAG: VOC family protein [Steroidobacteraceae bacterium]